MPQSTNSKEFSGVTKVTFLGLFIVFLGSIFYFYEYILRVSVSVMEPQVIFYFKTSVAGFGALSAYYLYIYTPLQLVAGVVLDMFSIRVILVLSALLCALGALMFPITNIYWVACVGRVLQGAGSAFVYIGALKLAANWLPLSRFAFFSCSCTAFGFLGAGLGEIILTSSVDKFGWRSPVFALSFCALILAVLFFSFLGKSPKALVHRTRKSKKIEKLTLVKVLSYLSEIVCNRYLWWAGILSCFTYLPTTVFAALWGIPYLIKVHSYDSSQASLACGLIFIGWAIGAPIMGWLSDFFQLRLRLIWISSLVSFVLSLILLYYISMPFYLVCTLFVVFGVSSSSQVLTFAMGRDVCDLKVVGMVMAFINTLSMLGGMIFQPGLGLLLNFFADPKLGYTVQSYEKAIFIVPLCCFLSFLIAFCIKDRVRY